LSLIADQSNARDPYVQLAAIRALAERGAVDQLPRILRCLGRRRGLNAVILADVLCRFGLAGEGALLDLAAASDEPSIRAAAVRALVKIGAAPSLDMIWALFNDESAEVRARVVKLLLKSDAAPARSLLFSALRDPAAIVRISAARVAGRLSAVSAAPLLVNALEDENWWVRYRAAEALTEISDKGMQILRALARRKGGSSSIAAQVIAERQACDVRPN
jgi:HEAT repeat protein